MRSLLRPLAAVFVVLLIVGFSPLVDAEHGWKYTLGAIIWWLIIGIGALLLVLGTADFLQRRRATQA